MAAVVLAAMGTAAIADDSVAELYATVATKKSRADLSQFLVKPAEKAAKARDWAHAIPLYQALVVARGAAGPEQKQLATLWTLAGQNEDAAEAWATYAAAAEQARSASTRRVPRLPRGAF